MLKPVEWRFVRVSTTTTIGLVVIIGAACGLGAAAVAGSRHGLVARYYANPEWREAPVVEGRDQRITTGALDERVMAIPDAADGGFSARWQGFLRVDQPAVYRFTVVAEDVAWLYYEGLLDGSRRILRRDVAVREIRAFFLPPGSDSEFLFRVLGGRIESDADWVATVSADGSVSYERVSAERSGI